MENMRDTVLKIHGTPYKVVLAVTGGGAEAIGELLRHGQGSKTLLEAVVPYDQQAFDNFVRGKPDKYCSAGAARDLAMASFQRGLKLTNDPLIGIGVSCSLAKDDEREGRDHHVYVAFQTINKTISMSLVDIKKVTPRTGDTQRMTQEAIVSEFIITYLAYICGAEPNIRGASWGLVRTDAFVTLPAELAAVAIGKSSVYPKVDNFGERVIFPGSFNPMHTAHIAICDAVHKITGKIIDLEICAHNVDKPALNYVDLDTRRKQIELCIKDKPWAGEIFFTGLPTFMEKAELFNSATFIVGWDTFVRINDRKYMNIEEVTSTFYEEGIRFLVFDRLVNGKSVMEHAQQLIVPAIMGCADMIGADILPPMEVSSSAIRKGNQ